MWRGSRTLTDYRLQRSSRLHAFFVFFTLLLGRLRTRQVADRMPRKLNSDPDSLSPPVEPLVKLITK